MTLRDDTSEIRETVGREEETLQPELATEAAVGRTSATDRDPTTSDKFGFWLTPDVIVNPFDIVEVDQVAQPGEEGSKTYGLVTMLEHHTDAPTHLANYISANFGDLNEEPNTVRQGTTLARVNVLSNDKDIYMPVPSEQLVAFASAEGIERALGIDQMKAENRIPAGLIKMSNGASTVAYLDSWYVLGPDGAHVNISGSLRRPSRGPTSGRTWHIIPAPTATERRRLALDPGSQRR